MSAVIVTDENDENDEGEVASLTIRLGDMAGRAMLTVCPTHLGPLDAPETQKVAIFHGTNDDPGLTAHVEPEWIEQLADNLLDVATIVRRNRGEQV